MCVYICERDRRERVSVCWCVCVCVNECVYVPTGSYLVHFHIESVGSYSNIHQCVPQEYTFCRIYSVNIM